MITMAIQKLEESVPCCNKQELYKRAFFYGLWFTRRHFRELYRERQSASISTTLDYILAHGSCQWLRAGQWTKCHRENGSAQQQERWDRDESRPCPFLQLSARISPWLIPLLVWLQQGHDLQRSQILQVSPVINQSNVSWVLSLWPSPQQFTHRALIVTVDIPHCASIFSKSSRGCKMVCKLWPSASHHHRAI